MKKYSIGLLILFALFSSHTGAMQNNPNQQNQKIKLIFPDSDQEIEIEKKILEQSVTLKNIVEDCNPNEIKIGIPLPNIDYALFQKLLPLMENLNNNELGIIKQTLNNHSLQDLTKLIEAANYLDIENTQHKPFILDQALLILGNKIGKETPGNLKKIKEKLLNLPLPFQKILCGQLFPSVLMKKALQNNPIEIIVPIYKKYDYVESIKFSPQNNYLFSLSNKGTISVFDCHNKDNITFFKTLDDKSSALILSPDGDYLASISKDNKTANIYDCTNFSLLKTLNNQNHNIDSLKFSPDSTYLALQSNENAYLYDCKNNFSFVKILPANFSSLAFSEIGNIVACQMEDSAIALYDSSADFSLLKTLSGHKNTKNYNARTVLAFCPTSNLLAVGDNNNCKGFFESKEVFLYDCSNKNKITLLKELYPDYYHDIIRLYFSPDGSYLAVQTNESLCIYDCKNKFNEIDRFFSSKNTEINSIEFSKDGNYLAFASNGTNENVAAVKFSIYNCKDTNFIKEFFFDDSFRACCTFSPNGKYFAYSRNDKIIDIYTSNNNNLPFERLLEMLITKNDPEEKGPTKQTSSCIIF